MAIGHLFSQSDNSHRKFIIIEFTEMIRGQEMILVRGTFIAIKDEK